MTISLPPRVGETVCGYRLLRELGLRARPRYVAANSKTRHAAPRVIVEIFEESEGIVRSARALAQVRHPNLTRVREVTVERGLVAVESEYVDGEWLADLLEVGSRSKAMPLGALLRVSLDVLDGLSAIHGVRGALREPLHLVHGEVAPSNILIGADGVARLAHPLRAAGAPQVPEVLGYLAPEVLLRDQSADERADVFSAGVLLWEALAGRRLHSATDAGEIVIRLLGGKVQLAEVPEESRWAQPLAEAAKRALSPELAARFATAAQMIAAVRWIAGENLGTKQDIVGLVETLAGTRIRARSEATWTAQAASLPTTRAGAALSIVRPSSPAGVVAPASSLRGDAPTPVPPRSWPVPAMDRRGGVGRGGAPALGAAPRPVAPGAREVQRGPSVPTRAEPSHAPAITARPPAPAPIGDAEPISVDFDTESQKQPAGAPPPAPKALPPPRLSIPTPIVPVAAWALLAPEPAASAPLSDQLPPHEPPAAPRCASSHPPAPAPVAPPVLAPLDASSVSEPTHAAISLAAPRDTDPPRRAPRKHWVVLAIAAVVGVPILVAARAMSTGPSPAPERVGATLPPTSPSGSTPAPTASRVVETVVAVAAQPAEDPSVRETSPGRSSAQAPEESPSGADERAPVTAVGNGAPATHETDRPPAPATTASGPSEVAPAPLRKKPKGTYYPMGI